ncbi:MAG: peptidylprolyl isomerase [Burkholderiaceae bacterium]|jgi:peptidyl-prolyl cis-trans isomerase A (cyclophilin A)|nr:peptidylprolyl isomerase [Burkholderiaceae bacterium]
MNAHAGTPGNQRGGRYRPRHLLHVGAMAMLATLTTGCGGGNDSEPAVTTMAASNARFSRAATLSINGRNLRAGIVVDMEGGCENLTLVANGTDDLQQYTCDVLAVGEFKANVHTTDGRFLGRLTFQVPQPEVSMTTSLGNFVLELDPVAAPATVRNFLGYVNAGFYRNVIFHRVIADTLVQSGGYTSGPVVKPPTAPPIKLESNNGLKNVRGSIGAARTSEPDSARAQWYVNVGDNPGFDYVDADQPGYAVFGRVTSGIETIDAISAVETRTDPVSGLDDLPVSDILVLTATQTR